MADKIFTDNDLLEEKSYDTKIMEGANVEPDTDYLEQVPFKKRLTEAIENGGGSTDYALREITFVNTLSEAVAIHAVGYDSITDKIIYFAKSLPANSAGTYSIVGSKFLSTTSKFGPQQLNLGLGKAKGTIASVTSDGLNVSLYNTGEGYYIVNIPMSVSNITLTVS